MTDQSTKPSLLLIAHTYAIDEHAKKLPALAKHFDLTCVTVTKSSWGTHFGLSVRDATQSRDHHDYEVVELDASGNVNSVTGFTLKGLGNIISIRCWDIILVENEPWSLLKWQTFFSTRLFCPNAMYGEFTWENIIRPGIKGTILSLVYKVTAKWADFWICGNKAAADIVHSYGMPGRSVLVSPQVGVDTEQYKPIPATDQQSLRASLGIPTNALVIGFAGRLVQEKGILELLEAVDEINASPSFQSAPVYLAFMGHGTLKEKIEALSKTKKWLLRFDPVPHHELPSFLQCLDILVLGSKRVINNQTCWEEQFGHVLIEAISCSVLTLGSRSGAIPEVLGDEDLLFSPGDKDELRHLLLRYINDKEARETKKSRLRKRLDEKYTHEAVADEWADFLLKKLHAGH